jgi:glyoxylase-like metal-dependent hydrolase (beta-lactamase superfamily II)
MLRCALAAALGILWPQSGTGETAVGARTAAPAAAGQSLPDQRARAALDAAVAAIGGEAALRRMTGIHRAIDANWIDPGQQPRPWSGPAEVETLPVGDRVSIEVLTDYATGAFVKSERRGALRGERIAFYHAGGSDGGFETNSYEKGAPLLRRHGAAEFTALRATELRRFPEALLLWALQAASGPQWIGERTAGRRREQIISFVDPSGRTLLLHLDTATRLPSSVEWKRTHPTLGDTVSEILFSDYRKRGGLKLPFHYYVRTGGLPALDYHVRSIRVGIPLEPTRFEPPAVSVPFREPPRTPSLHDLGGGVYEVLGSYNVAFALFRDYVLLVEAPVDEAYTKRIFELIRSVEPVKPIRLVSTHFHYDHIGGVRYAISQGVPIWTTSHTRIAIEQAIGSGVTFSSDELSRRPRAPVIEPVLGRAVFDDGEQRVEVYDIGPTEHSEQMLVAYFPRASALLAADIWDINAPEVAVPSRDARTMFSRLRANGARIERFIPVHGVPVYRAELTRLLEAGAGGGGE